MTAPMCAEHRMPAVECENVTLTRRRFARVCLCGHPKVVHEHWRTALDCGMCDCLHYETARSIRHARASSYAAAALAETDPASLAAMSKADISTLIDTLKASW